MTLNTSTSLPSFESQNYSSFALYSASLHAMLSACTHGVRTAQNISEHSFWSTNEWVNARVGKKRDRWGSAWMRTFCVNKNGKERKSNEYFKWRWKNKEHWWFSWVCYCYRIYVHILNSSWTGNIPNSRWIRPCALTTMPMPFIFICVGDVLFCYYFFYYQFVLLRFTGFLSSLFAYLLVLAFPLPT